MTDPHPQSGYARRLGLFDGTMLVMGGIIGAGIFLNPAVVAERTGTPFLAVGVWVLGGVVALAGALCFAELGARKPLAGGGYIYLRDAWGPLAAFLYGWTQLLVINSGGIAAVAMTFAGYAASLTGLTARMIPALAVGAIGLLSLVNYLGIKPGSMIQNLFTVLKLAALVGLILAGLLIAGDQVAPVADVGRVAKPPSVLAAVGIGLIPVLFAYGGWQSTNFVAGEMRDPVRDLPRALLLGVSGVVITYVLANIVYVRVLGIDGLAASTAPASDVMEIVLGRAGRTFIAAGIAFSTFGFLNLAILAAPRVYQAMAADGVFVGAAAQIDDRFHVPATAIFIQAAWAILLVSTRSYGQLLDYVVFGDWIFFGLVGATLWYYRRQDPGGAGFRLPGYPWVPLFFVTAATFTVISTVVSNPLNALLGMGIIGTGIPAFFWWKRRGTRA